MTTQGIEWITGSFAGAGVRPGTLDVTSHTAASAFELTPREIEVMHHLAYRATDREIADALSISPRTVMHHVSHVLGKLGAVNRRDAAVLAVHHDLF